MTDLEFGKQRSTLKISGKLFGKIRALIAGISDAV